MQTFRLNRKVDHSGVAGTGVVAEGVQFTRRCLRPVVAYGNPVGMSNGFR